MRQRGQEALCATHSRTQDRWNWWWHGVWTTGAPPRGSRHTEHVGTSRLSRVGRLRGSFACVRVERGGARGPPPEAARDKVRRAIKRNLLTSCFCALHDRVWHRWLRAVMVAAAYHRFPHQTWPVHAQAAILQRVPLGPRENGTTQLILIRRRRGLQRWRHSAVEGCSKNGSRNEQSCLTTFCGRSLSSKAAKEGADQWGLLLERRSGRKVEQRQNWPSNEAPGT